MRPSCRAQALLALAVVTTSGAALAQDIVPTRPDQPIDTSKPAEPPATPVPPPASPEPTPPETEKKPPETEAAKPADAPAPAPAAPEAKPAAPEAAPAPAAPAEPELEKSDDLEDAGYLPGYRTFGGIGTSPYAPRLGGFPGGVTPSFGAPMPQDSWVFQWKGYMSASLQVSLEERNDRGTGQRKLALHVLPNIVEEYGAFPSTNSLPGNWIGSSFVYGNNNVTATVSIDTWSPTVSTQNHQGGAQYFINNAYLTYRANPFDRARVAVNAGFFGNSYGALGRYGGGFYTNPMTATLQGAGEDVVLEYDLTDSLIAVVEHGFMTSNGPRIGLLPSGVITGTGNGGAAGDPPWPGAYVHHAHLGIVRKGDIQLLAQLHFLSNWFQDERVQRTNPPEGEPCDLPTTPELDECYVRDGRMRVIGFDAKMLSNAYGVLGIGGSFIDADHSFPLKGMQTFAGDGERVTAAWLGTHSEGTGKIWVGGIAYNMSVASLMLSPEPFSGQGPDVVINAGFNIGKTISEEEPFDGRVRHKFGADVLYTPFRYFGVGMRADRVVLASDDPDQTFHVIAPRLQFKSDWTSHEAIVLSYVRWFKGPHTHYDGLNPRSSARLDPQMFTLNFNMWW